MKRIILLLLAAILAIACSKENPVEDSAMARVSIEQGSSLFVKSTTEAPDTYYVETFASGNTPFEELSGSYGDFKGKDFTLPAGSYTVTAYNITEEEAEEGRGLQRFFGSTEVALDPGSYKEISFICKMANARVSFLFDDSFKNYFDLENTASPALISASSAANPGRVVTYTGSTTLAEDDGQMAYFNVSDENPVLNFTIVACRKSDSQVKSFERSITLQPQSWHQIIIKAEGDSGVVSNSAESAGGGNVIVGSIALSPIF